jgi:hypothetical protein
MIWAYEYEYNRLRPISNTMEWIWLVYDLGLYVDYEELRVKFPWFHVSED